MAIITSTGAIPKIVWRRHKWQAWSKSTATNRTPATPSFPLGSNRTRVVEINEQGRASIHPPHHKPLHQHVAPKSLPRAHPSVLLQPLHLPVPADPPSPPLLPPHSLPYRGAQPHPLSRRVKRLEPHHAVLSTCAVSRRLHATQHRALRPNSSLHFHGPPIAIQVLAREHLFPALLEGDLVESRALHLTPQAISFLHEHAGGVPPPHGQTGTTCARYRQLQRGRAGTKGFVEPPGVAQVEVRGLRSIKPPVLSPQWPWSEPIRSYGLRGEPAPLADDLHLLVDVPVIELSRLDIVDAPAEAACGHVFLQGACIRFPAHTVEINPTLSWENYGRGGEMEGDRERCATLSFCPLRRSRSSDWRGAICRGRGWTGPGTGRCKSSGHCAPCRWWWGSCSGGRGALEPSCRHRAPSSMRGLVQLPRPGEADSLSWALPVVVVE